ncbi:hypothetical protein NQ317_000701 [Molorchus minor]|uniref:RPAP1/MINIYO-like TPR repeats domain-containing protein n=1 Tax=Molorchus minor TaxID=1323400 RepID=A0ABQ9JCM4_9CUCU|nr:hypothetical protein NQ317_000701 [Molorchus minor]
MINNLQRRILYIINTVKPSVETIVYCMDILIRLARDSELVLKRIINCEGLLDSITKYFISKTSQTESYGVPLLQAVKFLRILSSRSKHIANNLITKWKVLDLILVYLSDDAFSTNVNGLRLQTECIHFWSVLVHYGLALDHFSVLQPVLLNMLDYHFKNTDLDLKTTFVRQGHVAGLLILLGHVAEHNYNLVAPFLPILIEKCLPKWTTQFSQLNDLCGKLQIISSLLYCLSYIELYCIDNRITNTILNMINSSGYTKITENIRSGSMLLNNYEIHKSSSNLKSLEAAAWHTMDHLVPLVQTNSCLLFLYPLSQYVQTSKNSKLKLCFLTSTNVQTYLMALQKLDKYYLTFNWFARPESLILMNILKISVSVRTELDTSIFYDLCVKCLCIFNAEQKSNVEYLLENIVFSPKFYPTEALLLKLGHFSQNCCIDISFGNVIPMDWPYTPILILYSNHLENKMESIDEEQQIFTIKNCLRWILIYETYFPMLASTINPTDRFCRLACVFLGSLSNFQDFYTQLLEQYQGVSYGDILFGNIIFIPLAQKHNIQYKKNLWSEYMGVVQIFNITPEQCICDLNLFLEPPEEDASLIMCYRRAIVNNLLKKNSVLYHIAKHHVEMFMSKKKTNKV